MIPMLEKRTYKTFKVIRSFAKFICIKLGPCLNDFKGLKTIELAEATKHTFEIV